MACSLHTLAALTAATGTVNPPTLTPEIASRPAASFLPAYLGSGASSTRRFQLLVLHA